MYSIHTAPGFKLVSQKITKGVIAVLIITASHQTFSGQFWCLSSQNKFDLTHLLYIINGKVSVFFEDKVMSGQISTLIISTGLYAPDHP